MAPDDGERAGHAREGEGDEQEGGRQAGGVDTGQKRAMARLLAERGRGEDRSESWAHAVICPEWGPTLRSLTVVVRGLRTLPVVDFGPIAPAVISRLRAGA